MRLLTLLACLLFTVPALGQIGGGGVPIPETGLPLSGGTLTGPLLLPDGTAGSPSWAWNSDNDGTGTGMYRRGANQLGFSNNGIDTAVITTASLTLLSVDLNPAGQLIFDSTRALQLGDPCAAPGITTETCVGGALQVDLTLNVTGQSTMEARLRMNDNAAVRWGTGSDYSLTYTSAATNFTLTSTDIDGGGTDGPVYTVEDGTDDILFSGNASIAGGNAKGALVTLTSTKERVTFPGGGGAASQTASSALTPDDTFIEGFTSRVVTTGTTCAGMRIGTAADPDLFGEDLSITDNATSVTYTAAAVAFMPTLSAATNDIVVTGTDGAGTPANCVDLVVDLVYFHKTTTAPTADE